MKPSTKLARAIVFLIKTENMTDMKGNVPTVASRLDFLKEQGMTDEEIAEAVRVATDGKGYPAEDRSDLH